MKQVMEPQNRPQRRSPLAMKCTVNRANLKPNAGTSVYIAVDLTPSAAVIAGRVRSISLAIDSSGSMDGEKIEQAKAAALALIKQLRPTDQISIVSFSDTVTVQLPMTQVGNSREVAAAVKAISVSGLTAMYDGLSSAFNQARRASQEPGTVNRVLLLTDGNPTVGKTDGREVITLPQGIREAGITNTANGLGTDYNEQLVRKTPGGRGEGHLASILVGRGHARRRSGLHRRPPAIERGDEPVPAHAPQLGGGHRPNAAGGAVEGCDRPPEGGDDHADHGDGCRRGDRDSREPDAERRRDHDAGRPGDGRAERPPAQRGGEEGLPAIDDDHRKEETEAVMNVTKCPACDTEYREGAKFCDTCGAKIEPEADTTELQFAVIPAEVERLVAPAKGGA